MKYIFPLLLILTTGCSFGGAQERDFYRLRQEAVVPEANDEGKRHGILQVMQPAARSGLEGSTIEIETQNGVSQVENAAWAEPLPVMLNQLVVKTMERSHRYASVTQGDSAVVATRQLQMNIDRFTLVLGETPHVDVMLRAEILNLKNGKLITSADLSASEPVEKVRMHFVIPAFERALARCLSELEDKTE